MEEAGERYGHTWKCRQRQTEILTGAHIRHRGRQSTVPHAQTNTLVCVALRMADSIARWQTASFAGRERHTSWSTFQRRCVSRSDPLERRCVVGTLRLTTRELAPSSDFRFRAAAGLGTGLEGPSHAARQRQRHAQPVSKGISKGGIHSALAREAYAAKKTAGRKGDTEGRQTQRPRQ